MKRKIILVTLLGMLLVLGGMPGNALAARLVTVAGAVQPLPGVPCRGMVALWLTTGAGITDPQHSDMTPYTAKPLNADCSFEMPASPGRYYLSVAIRQSAGNDLGPLRPGDLIFMSPDAEGNRLEIEVRPGQHLHVGTHSSSWQFPGTAAEVVTGIRGRLVDEAGQPLPGLRVQAFGTADMLDRPLAFSPQTGADGTFRLHLEEGSYYLIGQDESVLGIPQHGKKYDSFFGLHGGEIAKPLKVKQGQVIDSLQIVIKRRIAEKEE